MTTTAATWFYRQPEMNAYAIAERVRTTFWEARLTNMWLDCVHAESPFQMKGYHGEARVEIEWVPGRSFMLTTSPADETMAETVTRMLKFKPALRYENAADNSTIWEWQTDGGEKRWQEIQGKPQFHSPRRLTKK